MPCRGECMDLDPPPDMILSMPPPPLPAFLLPRSAIVAISGNETQPCFAPFMCEPSLGPRDKTGIEYIEISKKGHIGTENTWILVLVSSCIGVIVLGIILAFILIKCRESYNYTYQTPTIKPPSIGEPHLTPTSKQHPFMSGPVLYPCVPQSSAGTPLQNQLANENRVLWATLTPSGPQHYVTETYPTQDDHYEIIDHQMKINNQQYASNPSTTTTTNTNTTSRMPPIKSFENSAFIDYEYEDPVKYGDAYRTDDMDSGYQEPHDILGSLPRSRSPRHYPAQQQHHHHYNTISITASPQPLPPPTSITTNPINSSPIRNYPPPYHQQQQQQYQQHSQLLLQHHNPHHLHHHHQHHSQYPSHRSSFSTLNRKSNFSRKPNNCDDGSSTLGVGVGINGGSGGSTGGRYNM